MAEPLVGQPRFFINEAHRLMMTLKLNTTHTPIGHSYLDTPINNRRVFLGDAISPTIIKQNYMLGGGTNNVLYDSGCHIVSDEPFKFSCNYFAVLGLRNIPIENETAENIVDSGFWIGYYKGDSLIDFDGVDSDGYPAIDGTHVSINTTEDISINNTAGSSYGGGSYTARTVQPDADGFFIRSLAQTDEMVYAMKIRFDVTNQFDPLSFQLGSVFIGNTYDMPHRADMNMSINHEFPGVKDITTVGGSTLTQIDYYKSPQWVGDLSPWQIYGRHRDMIGRRTWDISFSYLTETTSDEETNAVAPDTYNNDYENVDGSFSPQSKNSFYNRVIEGTMGGALPFIFQPNKNVDEFALCKLDMKSFSIKKNAPSLASIKLKIKEIW